MLDVGDDPQGDTGAVGPAQRRPIDDRRKIEAVVLGRRGHDAAPSARLCPMVRRYCSVSSSETTSAYLACRSNRLCSCAARERSPTASRTTIGRKPFCTASTALARTHPLVVHPTMLSVSTQRLVSRGPRTFAKEHGANF